MLIEKIRTATGNSHAQLEKKISRVIAGIKDKADYSNLLKAFYGYVKPVQASVYNYIDPWLLTDIEKRRSASLLISDLLELRNYEYPSVCREVPIISTSQSAFGALYVLEGSTLGGKIIYQTISTKLNSNEGLRFFAGYGPNTGMMWKKFLQCLDHPENHQRADDVIDTALQTFTLFDSWIEKTYCNTSNTVMNRV